MSCEHCNDESESDEYHFTGSKCCWARAIKIEKFKKEVKHKYIIEVFFDLVISVSSVTTDILSLLMYFYKGKYNFAITTLIPVLLPTLVFTNVYLVDEKSKKGQVSKVTSISGKSSLEVVTSSRETDRIEEEEGDDNKDLESESGSTKVLNRENELKEKCHFHFSCFRRQAENFGNCFRGFFQCLCVPNIKLRRSGANAVRKSVQRMLKYGIGTIVLRFIACAWYIKAFIYGLKAYRHPKKFMKIETPNNHWSYELLVRLEFLQAALENAPQCVIQLYALITQPDEDKVLGMLTLAFSFIDFIRVSVYVHWDMDKGPVTAPSGCYDTFLWKTINTLSWILIYSARSAAIALVFATAGFTRPETLFPTSILLLHLLLFSRILSKAEYGVAAQKVGVTVFISLFFLPELAATVIPAIPQFYYATIMFENAFFILPWDGFGKEYCLSSSYGVIERNRTSVTTPRPSARPTLSTIPEITGTGQITLPYDPTMGPKAITPSPPPTEGPHYDCLIDPTLITLAVPTLTMIGIIFRLIATQKMVNFRKNLPKHDAERDKTQNKLEASIANLFSKKWSRMTINELASAFSRMLRKEVVVKDKSHQGSRSHTRFGNVFRGSRKKKTSFLSAQLQAEFLASQTFIRESFSLIARTTRSHDFDLGKVKDPEGDPDYNSDSELTYKMSCGKRRPRIPRSRNVSESVDIIGMDMDASLSSPSSSPGINQVQMEFPSGTHYLEMCWV